MSWWVVIALGCGGILAATWLVWRGIRWAGSRGEERGELSAQVKALAEGQKRAERARRKANRPLTGDPKVVARRMLARLRRHRADLQIDDIELPSDPRPPAA